MTTHAETTTTTGGRPVAVSAGQIALDMGRWLAHAVVAGVLIGLACSAVVTLIATAGA